MVTAARITLKVLVAEDYGLEYYCQCYDVDLDENGKTVEGAWVSSSEMC